MNLEKRRVTRLDIENVTWIDRVILVVGGGVGGFVSSVSGTGVDLFMFSLLTLYYRVNEKVATPTTVTIQAINTSFGFLFIGALNIINTQTWVLWQSSNFIAALGAPFGAFFSSFLHRQVLAGFIYVLDVAQFITAMIILKLTVDNIILIVCTYVVSVGLFFLFRFLGGVRLKRYSTTEVQDVDANSLKPRLASTDPRMTLIPGDNSVDDGSDTD